MIVGAHCELVAEVEENASLATLFELAVVGDGKWETLVNDMKMVAAEGVI